MHTQRFITVHNPRWTMKGGYPVTWMLLSWVMLTSQFIGVSAGTHWHSVMPLWCHRQLLDMAESWFPNADREPPDGDLICTCHVDFTFLSDDIDASAKADDDHDFSKQHTPNAQCSSCNTTTQSVAR